jgi:hypothetical protein
VDRKVIAQACALSGISLLDEEMRAPEELLNQKRWAEAMAAASTPKLPPPLPARAWRVIGIAACQLHNLKQGKEALSHVQGTDRAIVLSTCQRAAFPLDSKARPKGEPAIF